MTPELDSLFLNKFMANTKVPKLFHFTSHQASDIIVKNRCLRFSSYKSVNDDHEFFYGLELAHKLILEKSKQDGFVRVFLERYLPMLNKQISNPSLIIFMACFCTKSKNKYLWHKYGQNKTGMKIEFEIHDSDLEEHVLVGRTVIYRLKQFRRVFGKMIDRYSSFVKMNVHKWSADGTYDSNMKDVILSLHRDIFLLASFYKRRKFRKEIEYRVVMWTEPRDPKISKIGTREFTFWDIKNSKIYASRIIEN